MRSVFIYTTIVIVVSSVFSQRPLPRYSENLKKAVPQHWHHDQENPDRRLDQISRRHKVEPHEPPLRLHQTVPWLRWVHEGRWAAQADKNTELHKIRTQLLKEKLKPNHLIFKPHVNPQLRPNLKRKVKMRTKREAKQTEPEKVLKITETQGNIRKKRDLMMTPELLPEMIMQPHIQAQMPNPRGDFSGRIKETEIQDKKQIFDFINKLPQLFARSPRTTMNPFIRDTHIEDYDIIRPDAGEREGMIPTIESGYSDLESHPLVDKEEPETSNIISQLYLITHDEKWTEIQNFTGKRVSPFSELLQKQKKLIMALKSMKYVAESSEKSKKSIEGIENCHNFFFMTQYSDGLIHKRVKRRVNKTLQRKRAKKRKRKQNRVERKRLRMLTHARRLRKQQKSKQARLQRHYARMNMTTTEIPEHLRNQTLINEGEEYNVESKSRGETEISDETVPETENDDEYESSEYEDESESSRKSKSTGKVGDESNLSKKQSEGSENSETEDSIGGKPDYGNDDYEYGSDDDYDSDESSKEEPKKQKKKTG